MKKLLRHCIRRWSWILASSVLALAIAPALSFAETITYFYNDLLGSPVAATTNNSTVVTWRESYGPYGDRQLLQAASAKENIWFTSRHEDGNTELVYMGARYYDPLVGRFLAIDPKGFSGRDLQSFNRYAYASNNPYRYVDPNGRESIAIRQQERMQIQYLKGNISRDQLDSFYKAQEAGATIGMLIAGAVEIVAAKIAKTALEEAFQYTFTKNVASIERDGLRAKQFATTTGDLSPLQAQIDLALPPNRGLTDAVLRIDLSGLREAGYEIPEVMRVGRSFRMPGGGTEMQFSYPIPPQFITIMPP